MTPHLEFELLKVGHCTHPECVAMRGGRWASVPFPALCGLLRHPQRGWLLFDTGYSAHFMAATQPFPQRLYRWTTPSLLPEHERLTVQLRRRGIAPEDISGIVISHLHGDHIAGLRDFPRARFFVMRTELDSMRRRCAWNNLRHGVLPALLPDDFADRLHFADDCPTVKLPSALSAFGEGMDLFGDGSVLAVHLPGHTLGQIGLALHDETGRITFLCADACWSLQAIRDDLRPTWLARQLFDNATHYLETFARLRRLHLAASDVRLIPSHCMHSWLSHDKRNV
ncbi:MBL fold metallo-hydrolase [Herbaspirillum sp. NPDC087042]|uniref:MBL fold metallo-hydrolase n=1 Tax=Herbaspirillum sp. NPDC087042 TaxID=3364004 RepID=UPI00381CE102